MCFPYSFSFNTFIIKNLFSLTSWLKPYRFICCLHYELHKSNHTGLDLRIAFHWLKDNGKSHWPGTVLRFISLLSSLCLRLVPKTDTWSHDFCNSSYSFWCHVRVSLAFLCVTGCPLLLYSCVKWKFKIRVTYGIKVRIVEEKKTSTKATKKLQNQTILWKKLHVEKRTREEQ